MTDAVLKVLQAVAPRANAQFLANSGSLGAILQQRGFDTVDAQSELIAQCAHESAGFTAFSENLNYSAERLVQVWPRRFRTIDDARAFAKNPQALANNVYGNRMGNRPGTDDGWNFRGSGALQHTGRSEYDRVARRLGSPALTQPDILRDPTRAVTMWQAAATFFIDRGALAPAKKGDTAEVTRLVNGGVNGLADRKLLKSRAMAALMGEKLPIGKTTVEEANDAKRRAKNTTVATAGATPTTGGAGKGAGLEPGQVAVLMLAVIIVGVGISFGFWRRHRKKKAIVEVMSLQNIVTKVEQ